MVEPILPFDELLAPIPGDNPAGRETPFQITDTIEKKRKEVDPNQWAPDDPMRPTEAIIPDWAGIMEVAKDSLINQSKDFKVAADLFEATTRVHGFAGLAEGCTLLRRMIEECWDRAWPDISNGAVSDRAGPFNAINTKVFGYAIRAIPMVVVDQIRIGFSDWTMMQKGRGYTKEDFGRAVTATSREDCQAVYDNLHRAIEEYNKIDASLRAKLGEDDAPSLTNLSAALSDCYGLAKLILTEKGPAADSTAETAESGGSGSSVGSGSTGATREQIYLRIRQAADDLERLEPHSPIPYLLRRATKLGGMKFPELIRALLAEGATLGSLEKEFALDLPT